MITRCFKIIRGFWREYDEPEEKGWVGKVQEEHRQGHFADRTNHMIGLEKRERKSSHLKTRIEEAEDE